MNNNNYSKIFFAIFAGLFVIVFILLYTTSSDVSRLTRELKSMQRKSLQFEENYRGKLDLLHRNNDELLESLQEQKQSSNDLKESVQAQLNVLGAESDRIHKEEYSRQLHDVMNNACLKMAGMLMRKITPATGTNPSYHFNSADIQEDEDETQIMCSVTLKWDAKVTRFDGTYLNCELTGDMYIVTTAAGQKVAVFYPKTANRAVGSCEASSSWRNEEYFSASLHLNF